MNYLIAQHKAAIAWFQKKTGLSNYGVIWCAFLEGVVLTLIIERLIVHP